MRYLIDTHVALWVFKGEQISEAAKVILDDFLLVSHGNEKFVEVEAGEILHNVPENGVFADLHHWFRP